MTLELDHLLFAGPDLPRLLRDLHRFTGHDPAPGGRHVNQGTHNALVGLGSSTYLELIALDPSQPDGGGWANAIGRLQRPSLHAWCMRSDDPDAVEAKLTAAGTPPRRTSHARTLPSGESLTWELLFPKDHDFAGAAPFFIAWGDTPHPARALPAHATLRHLVLQQRDPVPLRTWLADLGVTDPVVRVEAAPSRGLRAELHGQRGPFVLRGAAGGMAPELHAIA